MGCVVDIDAAERHLCALLDNGQVHCFGDPADGVAQADPLVYDGEAERISVGRNHACLRDDGIKCWGNNDMARFVPGGDAIVLAPTPVTAPTLPQDPVDVAAGRVTTCIPTGSAAFCLGQLEGMPEFTGVGTAVDIVAGGDHTCVLDAEGRVACAATQEMHGQLNVDGLPTPVTSLAATRDTTCALTDAEELWCWGRRESGVVPGGGGAGPTPPLRVAENMLAFDIELPTSCALGSDDRVHCLGDYFCGDTPLDVYTPIEMVGDVSGLAPIDVAVGRAFMCLLAQDGTVHCWGEDVLGTPGACTELRELAIACP